MEGKIQEVLEVLVSLQKEQRLKDVAAYESLLKKKESLEASLAALASVKDKSSINEGKQSGDSNVKDADGAPNCQLPLAFQFARLKRSLATLTAEKSQMEASFQADKKQIRSELLLKDKTISELQESIKELNKKHALDLDAMKSKFIIERQEREKESNNYMFMIRELQKLYADERHLKENLEMQLNYLKTQFSIVDDSDSNYQELKSEQHAVSIETEPRQAHTAEERSNLIAFHGDRIAHLEVRLAELSTIVGTHERLRQQDQTSIQKLRDKINAKENAKKSVPEIVDEIMQLKKLLTIENAKSNNPVDINEIFITDDVHNQCIENINKLQADLNACESENSGLKQTVENQKNNIKNLRENVKGLNKAVLDKNVCKSENTELKQTVEVQKKTLQENVKEINKLQTDLKTCKLESFNLKMKVENQKKSLASLNEKLRAL